MNNFTILFACHSNVPWRFFVLDLPRASKLCTSICAVKRRKNRDEVTMLYWGNVALFDWRTQFCSGKMSLILWGVPHGINDDLLNSIGCVGSNPVKDAPCLELIFEAFDTIVLFPKESDFQKLAQMYEIHRQDPSKNVTVDLAQESIDNNEKNKHPSAAITVS